MLGYVFGGDGVAIANLPETRRFQEHVRCLRIAGTHVVNNPQHDSFLVIGPVQVPRSLVDSAVNLSLVGDGFRYGPGRLYGVYQVQGLAGTLDQPAAALGAGLHRAAVAVQRTV